MTTPSISPPVEGYHSGERPRILVVAYHFPPEASVGTHRTLRLVRELVERQWDVTVLTGTRSTYSASCPIDLELLERVPSAIRVVRAPVFRPFERLSGLIRRNRKRPSSSVASSASDGEVVDVRQASWLQRVKRRLEALVRIPDPHVGWLLPALTRGILSSRRRLPDVLYSTAPSWTGHLVARMLAPVLGCPWAADFRDPWARAPWREDRPTIARVAAEVFERAVIRRADAIAFTTRTNLEENTAFYGESLASKFHLVRNGFDRDELEGLSPLARDGRFTLLHAGSMYGGRKPAVLLSALASLRDRGVIDARRFCFRQIGRVALGGFDIAAERARLGLDGLVDVVPTQPRREILREMLSASCLLLLQPGTTVSIPGKLFEYMATGRPILAIVEEGETADLVRSGGCGAAVLPDDQAGIERALEALIENRLPVREAPRELFDGQLRTRELLGVLEAIRRVPLVAYCASTGSAPEV